MKKLLAALAMVFTIGAATITPADAQRYGGRHIGGIGHVGHVGVVGRHVGHGHLGYGYRSYGFPVARYAAAAAVAVGAVGYGAYNNYYDNSYVYGNVGSYPRYNRVIAPRYNRGYYAVPRYAYSPVYVDDDCYRPTSYYPAAAYSYAYPAYSYSYRYGY